MYTICRWIANGVSVHVCICAHVCVGEYIHTVLCMVVYTVYICTYTIHLRTLMLVANLSVARCMWVDHTAVGLFRTLFLTVAV